MTTKTMRVTDRAMQTVRHLARVTGQKQLEVVDRAIELYRRQLFLKEANLGFAALKNNTEAWSREAAERAEWDDTLADA